MIGRRARHPWTLALIASGLCGLAVTAMAADDSAAAWQAFRKANPDRMAEHDAIPYSSEYRPDLYRHFEQVLPAVEAGRRRLAAIALQQPDCPAIEQVHADPTASSLDGPRPHLVFWAECEGGVLYHADQAQLAEGRLVSRRPSDRWTDGQLMRFCEEVLAGNRPSDRWPSIIHREVSDDPEQGRKVTIYFQWRERDAKAHAQQAPTQTVICTQRPGQPPRANVQATSVGTGD